jgi:hypothetical protein
MPASTWETGGDLEAAPPLETERIDSVAALTLQLLDRRYATAPRVLRGVHPKDHGCVEATFTVAETLAPEHRVGLFKRPGQKFRAAIRFSNAATLVMPDSPPVMQGGKPVLGPDGKPMLGHDSRGMAIKVYDVTGPRLVPNDGERTQDFLMINQPVFAFANVEDYEALNQIILKDMELPDRFFQRAASTDVAVQKRAMTTLGIVRRIKALASPPAFQPPPLSPLDNTYFSAAPFLFGKGRAMKFSAVPVVPSAGSPGDALNDRDYLRGAMRKRMSEAGGKDICFDFKIQVRSAAQLAGKIETEIEDVCTLWDDPFVTVARIAIPPQDIDAPARQDFCERLAYTPWHGLEDHRPLGGINRMRKKVYEASAERRGCPVSPNLPGGPPRGGVVQAR